MADLPTLADRLNDVEVSADAPLTETFFRRVGSNINFLLDFLGVTDGATSPSGDLQEFINAITTISGHTMDSQVTFGLQAGVVNVGTFTTQKYVNQVFYLRSTSFTSNIQIRQSGVFSPIINIDAAGNQTLPISAAAAQSTANESRGVDYLGAYQYDNVAAQRRFSKVLNFGDIDEGVTEVLIPFAEIDYRDSGTNFQLFFNAGTSALETVAGTIYREYRLNAGSLGF